MKKIEKEKDWYNMISYMINCDNLANPGWEKVYERSDIKNYNSKGETFGLAQCITVCAMLVEDKVFNDEKFRERLAKLLEGEDIAPTKTDATGFGLKFMTLLWKMPPNFKAAVEIIMKQYELIPEKS